jgi:hypothetical protein
MIIWYLGHFDTNYIIFRNVEIFKKKKSEILYPKENEECDGIFGNMSFVKMKSSKFN